MTLFDRILRSNFLIKLRSWEYWPFGIVQAPIFIYWLWLSAKARSFLFFSASNPGILTGGMFGESKFEVLKKIPDEYKPKGFLIKQGTPSHEILKLIEANSFNYPVIFKPDLGERGWMVKKIKSKEEAEQYIAKCSWDFIVQEYVHLPYEFSVFYSRHPDQASGKVSSVTMKKMLTIEGDGSSTLEQLILAKDRAKLQWEVLQVTFANRLHEVPAKGTVIELVPIGNHCLGTTFLNHNHLITPELSDSFDKLSKQVDGFYFGRYDLRAASFEDLEKGKVKVMELNGCGAEPSHIYHPGASFFRAVADLFVHWRTIYAISAANHKKGVPYLSLKEGIQIFKRFKAVTSS